ncbi:MAG: hypothetical protein DMG42_29000 [Acidobacteria bacterium]|nr:MAG: hypothetical protein DMG42_29000 [Acidobacteriota bacterium]
MKEPIEDKAPKPPGLLPKHVQSWLILGLAVLMIVIMWLTGGKKHESATKATVPVAAAPQSVELNESKIAELQSRIQELQREQLVAQSALAHESRLLGGMPSGEQQANVSPHPSAEHTEDRIKAERRTREYLSLFASNLALSYRKAANRTEPGEPEPAFPVTEEPRAAPALPPQDAALLSQMLNDAPLGVSPQSVPAAELTTSTPPEPHNASASPETSRPTKEVHNPAAAPRHLSSAAAGKTYILFEGTILEAVLLTRLDGQFTGPVECLLTNDMFSHDRQHLLIPAGSKILGETRKVDAFGQTRLAVLFHRLIMPDGFSLSLDQFKGLNQPGDAGLRDQVNNRNPQPRSSTNS